MQQYADFIPANFLYMFRASSAHHQEYKTLTRQPPVQVDMDPHFAIWRSEDPPATITTCTGGCRVSILLGTKLVPNMTEWRSTCNHNYLYQWLLCQYFILLMMGAWRPKHVEKVCSNKICIFLHHVSGLFNLMFMLYYPAHHTQGACCECLQCR
jgi:hypothetical protein